MVRCIIYSFENDMDVLTKNKNKHVKMILRLILPSH